MERSLSKNEAKVVLDLEWRGQTTVTLGELRQALGASESYARFLAHKLVQKGWLERLRPGLYRLVPATRGREGVADANPLAAGGVLIAPYFFSFGTACTFHGLTEQVFVEVYIACQERRRPVVARGKRYVFVEVPEERFFGFDSRRLHDENGPQVPHAGRSPLAVTADVTAEVQAALDALARNDPASAVSIPGALLERLYAEVGN